MFSIEKKNSEYAEIVYYDTYEDDEMDNEKENVRRNEMMCESAHFMFMKGKYYDISEVAHVRCLKVKEKENKSLICKLCCTSNNNSYVEYIKYIIMFDECFIYMVKDNFDIFNAKIGNHYNLNTLSNILILNKNEHSITAIFTFHIHTTNITKKFMFLGNNFFLFISLLKRTCIEFNIPLLIN